ncbi:hypothetical protein WJX72_007292 [[Myrmecia] bisecta]|uniref:Uncharacterized protein n=1 Tax=[Myrmecia] bisecta TaxID=41462 RepID=A0AAW1Q3D4_9CHLO
MSGARVFAHPSRVLTVESKAAALEGPPELQWQIEDDLSSFRSRTFLIRYAQEEVLLGEVACFHVHLDALQGLQQTDCLLEFQLMFQAPSKTRILEPPALINMKCVAKQTFRMVACANGYHEYCPVQFDTTHMVLCNVTLHATLLGLGCGTLDMDQAAPRGSWSDSPGLRRQRRHSAASVVGPVQRSERSTGSFTQILTDHLSCTRCTRCVSLDLVRTGTGLLPNELASATSAPTGNSLASTTLLAHGSGGSDQLLSNTSSADGSAVDENADLRSDVPNRRGRSHRARRGSAIPAYGADYGASRIPDLVAEMDELAQGDLAGHNPLVHFLQCDTCARAAAAEGAWSEAAMHSGVHARMQHVYEKLTAAAAMMHNWAGRRVQVAANWTCLIWILRHAALQLLGLLKQRWEAAQVEAFSMWVMDGPHAAASPAPLAGTKSQRRKSQSYVMDLKTSLLGLSPRFSYPGKPQAQSLSPGLSPRLGKPERSPNSLFSMARSLACMSASASVTLEMADLDSLGDDKSWDGSESGASAASSLHGRIPAMRSHHSAANLPKDAAIGECRAPQGASGHPAILAFSEPNPQPPASGLQMAVGQHSLGPPVTKHHHSIVVTAASAVCPVSKHRRVSCATAVSGNGGPLSGP